MSVVLAIWCAFVVGALFGYWLAGGFRRLPPLGSTSEMSAPTRAEINAGMVFRTPGSPCAGCDECQP